MQWSLPRIAIAFSVALSMLILPSAGGSDPAIAGHASSHFAVSREGNTYRAQSATKTYTGALKNVVESAVSDLNGSGGGTVSFTSGDFDLGAEWFRFEEISDITFEGQGMDATVIRNYTTVSRDTEPFNFRGTNRVVIRDLTVSAGGSTRTTSDAIDFDKGNNSVVERVKITASRGKGIIFDGKDRDRDGTPWTAEGNLVRDCVIQGTNNDGIQFLAASNNRVEGCTISNVVGDGIEATKSSKNASQPNKKSDGNVIIGNTVDNAGENGIRVNSSDRNRITGNTVTNSSDDRSGMDGIRITAADGILCNDNIIDGNTATDTQAVKTQTYGLHITTASCHGTVVGSNNFSGNRTGDIRDRGTNTRYESTDTEPPSTPENLVATAVSHNRVDLSWTASTDNVGVAAYDVYRDGLLLASIGAVASYVDTAVAGSTFYTYQVRARDAAGNASGLSSSASVTTPVPPPTMTFLPTDDAHVRDDRPTSNFGRNAALEVDGSPLKDTLLKFTISGVGERSVTEAKLRLFCLDPSNVGGIFYRVSDVGGWTEGTVTWNTAPAAEGSSFASIGSVASGNWYEVNVPFVSGDGTYAVRIASSSSNGADYSSKEGASPPQIVVTAE